MSSPSFRLAPESRAGDRLDHGRLACALIGGYGTTLDGWQADDLTELMRTRADGVYAASIIVEFVARQNGKNVIVEARELYGMTALGEHVLHTAHEVKTARKAFRRILFFFESPRLFPELHAMVVEIRKTNGQEMIRLKNGGQIEFIARTSGSGRGYEGIDLLVCDEVQELTEEQQSALLPTISASTLGNPQKIYIGTPPDMDNPHANKGVIAKRLRQTAHDKIDERMLFIDYGLPDGDLPEDLLDRDLLERTNPGLASGRLGMNEIRGEHSAMSREQFARERHGWWGYAKRGADVLFPVERWESLVSQGPPSGTRPQALAVDMSHDRLLAVAACWTIGDKTHVELVAVDYQDDTLAAATWIATRAGRTVPVVVDQWSPAASMVPELRRRRVKVDVCGSGAEMARAVGGFFDDLGAERLTHADQDQLTAALAGAKRRKIGDAGGWGLDRRDPAQNIAPLVACVLARYGTTLTKQTKVRAARPGASTRVGVVM
jgi:hypothetical protein